MKKEYKKPTIKKVSLKVEQTVLGGCKFSGYQGDGSGVSVNCNFPTLCVLEGS